MQQEGDGPSVRRSEREEKEPAITPEDDCSPKGDKVVDRGGLVPSHHNRTNPVGHLRYSFSQLDKTLLEIT
jgi:hypothetical protein